VALLTEQDQRDLARVSTVDRVRSLTGIRALAALLVVGTHAAYGTGKEAHGYVGLLCSRLEIGVPIFFALSGFLLFRPWVKAAVEGSTPPLVGRYLWRRARRIMPAYVAVVLAAYLLNPLLPPGPTPAQTWVGLLRHLTLTQIYTNNYMLTYLHQGLTQMWSLAVEVAFYAVLPLLSYLLLVVLCGRCWRPGLLLAGLGGLAALTPVWLIVLQASHWLPNSAGMWLPAHLACFAGGMALAVLQAMGARCYAFVVIPLALVSYLIVATPIAGDVGMAPVKVWQPLVKAVLYMIVATLMLAPLVLGDRGWYVRMLGSRPMVWLGEISYEIFLIHVFMMAIAIEVLGWPAFTGSMTELVVVTLMMTVPLAWVLHRTTQPRPDAGRRRPRHETRLDEARLHERLGDDAPDVRVAVPV